MTKTTIRGTQILAGSVDLTAEVENQLPVANGGTGAATLTGLLVGNGTSAVTTVTAPASAVVGVSDAQTLSSKTLTSPVVNGTVSGTGVATGATASTLALRDANGSITATNILEGYASTATSGGTTTLTVSSAEVQVFTGTAAQTVVLPAVTTLSLGQSWTVVNLSTGTVTIQTSGGNTLLALAGGITMTVMCQALTGTGTSSWIASADLASNADVISKVLTGFASGLGTVSSSDSILTGMQKVAGNATAGLQVGGTVWQSYGVLATGIGQMTIPFYVPCNNLQITWIQYWNSTAGSGGSSTAELLKNGQTTASAVSGSSGTPAASSPTALTGLSLNFVQGDQIYIYSTAVNTTPAIGLAMMWRGTITG